MLETERLILRRWRRGDHAPFASLNADARVMAHFPRRLPAADSNALVSRLQDHWSEHGFGVGVVERKADAAFLGMAGLAWARFEAPVCPCVEIGWRLAAEHWGQGYATEAALAWAAYGFGALELAEIVAFVVPANLRSQAVMARLGMRRDPARDFDHPHLPPGSPLRQHWLFACSRAGAG